MYRVYANDELIFDSSLSTEEDLQLLSPKLTMQKNEAGEFSFVLPVTHRCWGTYVSYENNAGKATSDNGHKFLLGRTDRIVIYKDSNWLWEGCPENSTFDLDGNVTITCSGALNYLDDVTCELSQVVDTTQRVGESDTAYAERAIKLFMTYILNYYNERIDEISTLFNVNLEHKKIRVGEVTNLDELKLPFHFSRICNFETCKEAFEKRILNDFGGQFYLSIDAERRLCLNYRFAPGESLINSDSGRGIVELGKNLLEYDVSENFIYATSVIVFGDTYDDDHPGNSKWWLKDDRSYAYDLTQRAHLGWTEYHSTDPHYPEGSPRLLISANITESTYEEHRKLVEKYGFHDVILEYDSVIARYPNNGWNHYDGTEWNSLEDYLGASDGTNANDTSTTDPAYINDYMKALKILGKNYLETQQFGNMTLEISATEINAVSEEKDYFIKETGELLLVSANIFANHLVPYEITKLSIALDDDTDTTITLGGETVSLTTMIRYN